MAATTDDDIVMHEEEDEELESSNEALKGHETDSACEEDLLEEDIDSNEAIIPQTVLNWADHALARLPPRWRNWITRVISGLSLISGFSFLVSLGASGLFFLTFLVVFASYNEVLKMGCRLCGVHDMSKWCWFLYLVIHWLVISGDLFQNWQTIPLLPTLFKYNLAFGFAAYLALMVTFVLSMKEQEYMKKYALFAWCHIWLLFFVLPCHLLNKATMSGIIWYVMPMSIITINDIGAYMVGFFGGKTPLIKLSPKKTKEGFIGGAIITVILGTVFTYYLMTPYLVCPVQSNPNYLTGLWMHLTGSSDYLPLFTVTQCQPSPAFTPTLVSFGSSLSFTFYPFVLHGFFVSLFSSLIGPFGGFLASGLKRACKRKNFGSFIPGHGGVLDRCDCMFLMAAFSYVYLETMKTAQLL